MAEEYIEKKKGRFFLIPVLIILVVVFGGVGVYKMETGPVNRQDKEVRNVKIPSGASTDRIGSILREYGVVRSSFVFKLYSKINNKSGKYQAGDYALSPDMELEKISNILASGRTNTVGLVIPEGYTNAQIEDRIVKSIGLPKEDVHRAIYDVDYSGEFSFLKKGEGVEGYLFPDTYMIPANSEPEIIVRKMLKEFQRVISDRDLTKMESKGFSLSEIITIASIIEKESGVPADRAKVSSVIYNRLDSDMLLQMDSTIQYVMELDGCHKEHVSYKDVELESLYNTYKNKGLPPGPICNPGSASIDAAIHPKDTDYLYFVLSEKLDGSSVFSKSYSKFKENKNAYHRAIKERDAGNKKDAKTKKESES